MTRLEAVRSAVAAVFRHPLLWVVQLLANLILICSLVGWLLIPMAGTWQLALNALFAVAILVAVVTVHAGTLNYFYDTTGIATPKLTHAFQRAVRHILAISVCVIVICLLWNRLDKFDPVSSQIPPYIRSILPLSIRRHFSLAFLENVLEGIRFVVRWIGIPGLLLPLIARTADLGFRGFGKSGFSTWWRAMSSASYCLVITGASLVGVLATPKIMSWTPDFRTSTLRHESISLALRLPLAYLLAVLAWLLTCSMLGQLGGRQRDAA